MAKMPNAGAKGLPLRVFGIFLMAAGIGAAGGLLGVGFTQALQSLQKLFMGRGGSIVDAGLALATPWHRVLVPTIGGLLAGFILLVLRGKKGPFGIAEITELVVTRKGVIRIRQSLTQVFASACTIASGGSIGREGANSQLAATVGAALAKITRSGSRTRAVLLGCGVAAGMAYSYNAPIAGALFVMEVVLGNFAMDVFAPVVVASVVSTLVSQAILPRPAGIYSATVGMTDSLLILSAILLGAVCGVGAVFFTKSLEVGRAMFKKTRLPLLATLPIGGALVGAIGIWHPQVWGNGLDVVKGITGITRMDQPYGALSVVFSIMILKVVATAVTRGSGGLGGVFTPTLVVGAALGAGFAWLVSTLIPGESVHLVDNHKAFALVGMAGLCSAIAHAPITAVILVFELTRDYQLILPLMLCSIIASIVARMIDKDSIYSARLRTKGHAIAGGIEALAMQSNYVRDIMRADLEKVNENATFEQVLDVFANARHDTIYVVDAGDILIGRIHIHDVKFFINDPSLGSVVIAADLTRSARPVHPDDSLAAIIELFDDPDLEDLPVVSEDRGVLEARLTRRDVIAMLSDQVLGQRSMRARLKAEGDTEDTYVELPPGCELARVAVPPALIGRAFDSLDLIGSAGLATLLVIETDANGVERRMLPDPAKVFQPRSSLVVLGHSEAIEAFRDGKAPIG